MARIIKKYANRRLYDTTGSKHITVDGIRELIVAGEDVRVVDDTTDEDITRGVLLQIISDKEKSGRPLLSDRMLTQLIRFYGHPMQEMMTGYLENSFNMLAAQQEALQKQFNDAMAGMTAANPMLNAMANPLASNPFANNPLAATMEELQAMAKKNAETLAEMQKMFMAGMQPSGSEKKKD